MDEQPTIATRADTVAAILRESGRKSRRVPLRASFLQGGRQSKPEPGPLADLVRRGRDRVLEQYLLLLLWATSAPYDVTRDSRIWARACGLPADASGQAAISRGWAVLRELQLVRTERRGRLAQVFLLKEDGSGEAYTHPGGAKGARYLQIPFAYWEAGFNESLTLPGKALLLIALSRPDYFELPPDKGRAWYGLSPSTVKRGLDELRSVGLLTATKVPKPAPLSPQGYTIVNKYLLQDPFGPRGTAGSRVAIREPQVARVPDAEPATPGG